ncbi:MAG: NERD domain-containing protein [Desulfosarcina sp.]|nr:NERD domain-containing protein [Desulfobacterales bacterium]
MMNLPFEKIESLLPLFLIFGVLVLMLALLQRKLGEIRVGFSDERPHACFLRSPGESILARIDRATGELVAFGVAVAVVPLVLILTYLVYVLFTRNREGWMDIAYLVCLSTGFLLYGGNKLRRLSAKKRRLRKVYAGLQAVALEINRLMLSGHHVYHDFPSGGFYIDHIIVGPTGVFTVQSRIPSQFESANGSQDKTVSVDGNELIFRKTTDTRAIQTTAFRASWLASWVLTATGEALRVHPLLTLPGWTVDIIDEQDVITVDSAKIGDVIRTTRVNPLSTNAIHRLCTEIENKYRCELSRKRKLK